ncbi:DUF4440 domain-containing protein [Actinomycetospora cinnamomea]|uniref:Uncharacterized protein DUF4440 n=1 Tax=Actinomycetospora cinnamomea TaxID=663609 RepID=A0A2U1F8D4_9PSEU|nr:nuclear transport factor 2 family protein [Actinomycetospora cinnamomea]PVZ08453.1 uncharacterized protein DUF4440 [Actinomycetospora cinnamomea]
MTTTELVERYFATAVDDDVERYVALFADDAVVVDDGGRRDDLRAWRRDVPAVTYDVEAIEPGEGVAHADAVVAGDFPGSPVRLDFAFAFDADGRITALTIRPRAAT